MPRNIERGVIIWGYSRRDLFVVLRSKAPSKVLPMPLLVAAKRREFLMNSRRRMYTFSGVISLIGGVLPIMDTVTLAYFPRDCAIRNRRQHRLMP